MIPMTNRMMTLDEALWGLGSLQREMMGLFAGQPGSAAHAPAINVWSDQEKTVVTAELPGVDPSGINIAVLGDSLTIEGERQPVELGKDEVLHRQERNHGPFSRSIALPYEVAADKVSAKYNRGLLEVTLPRHEASKPRKIAVSGG